MFLKFKTNLLNIQSNSFKIKLFLGVFNEYSIFHVNILVYIYIIVIEDSYTIYIQYIVVQYTHILNIHIQYIVYMNKYLIFKLFLNDFGGKIQVNFCLYIFFSLFFSVK